MEPADVPKHFLCPISSETMRDPVILASGQKWRGRKGKRASRHNGDNKDDKKLVSPSVRAELQFPASHIHQQLKSSIQVNGVL